MANRMHLGRPALADRSLRVTSFDFAPNALAKARRLAQHRNVRVDQQLGDAYS
jgi:hypothetical protein